MGITPLRPSEEEGSRKFSILIPSWNNLGFLKLCVESIRKNSTFPHQIIVHVNDGSDGTLEWVCEQKLDYTHSVENVGVCYAMNMARTRVETDYIVYMNDDMYACPGWDAALWREIGKQGTKYFFLSGTMIEPYPTGSKPVIAEKNFGTDLATFDEQRLLREFMSFEKLDWSGATRPPNLIHKDLWDLVGGYSVEFSPGLYSDPDFSMKLWNAGVRDFRGIGDSRVYHFVSKSLTRIAPNNGHLQFLTKWGITCSTFYKFYLKKGTPGLGANLVLDESDSQYRRALLKCRLQRFLSAFK